MWDKSKVRKGAYEALWFLTGTNFVDLGGLDTVDPTGLKLLLDPVKVGPGGKMKLDDWVDGLEDGSVIKTQVREISRGRIEALAPWFSGTAGASMAMGPAAGTRMSQWAHPLVLHPTDVATSAQDLEIYLALPKGPFAAARDGQKFDVWEMEWVVYPVISKVMAGEWAYSRVRPAGPAAPTNLAATPSSNSASLTWTENASDETGLEVWVAPDPGVSWTRAATPAANATNATVSGLASATSYWARVRAVNASGDGWFTPPVSFTTT
jgi:hypothetical protein